MPGESNYSDYDVGDEYDRETQEDAFTQRLPPSWLWIVVNTKEDKMQHQDGSDETLPFSSFLDRELIAPFSDARRPLSN